MVATVTLKGSASQPSITIANVGHGLMGFTWVPKPVADEQAFESIKAGIDALPTGIKAFLNGGEFYGPDRSNLYLISRFFKKYPEYADRTFLSIKGGTGANDLTPNSSPENLRRSVNTINEALGGAKRLDLFESARVDPKVPIEETIKNLKALIDEGLFDYIGLSECKAETLKRAHAVHPIAAVEIEVSLFSYEEETKKVIATAGELGVAVIGYSPVGRGFLTGGLTKFEDIPEGDMRRHLTRFQPENFGHNLELAHAVSTIAKKKGVTPAQLAIGWVVQLGPHVVALPGSSKKVRTLENLGGGDVTLSADELEEINTILGSFTVKGGRYNDAMESHMHLWG